MCTKSVPSAYLFVQEVLVVEFDGVDFLDHVLLEVAVDVQDVLGDVSVGSFHVDGELCCGYDYVLICVFRGFEGLFLLLLNHRLAVLL